MSQEQNDIQHLTSTIAGKIREGAQKTESFSSLVCINRVPKKLRKVNKNAYTPQLVAIGPLHRNDKHLQTQMHHVKMSYTNYLLSRLTARVEDPEVLQECVAQMKTSLDDAKKCYALDVPLDEEMMLVDGCFILEFLYRSRSLQLIKDRAEKKGKKPIDGGDNSNSQASSSIQQPHEGEHTSESSEQEMADPIFDIILTENIIKHDLLLLENQIPFFVLEKLFKLTVEKIPNRPHECSLTDYVLFCFRDVMSSEGNSSPDDCVLRVFGEGEQPKHYFHILHLLHEKHLPRVNKTEKTFLSEFTLSASNLEYAGVQFKSLSGNDQFDVKFDEDEGLSWWCRRASFAIPALLIGSGDLVAATATTRILENGKILIPSLLIHDPTEPFLRNLIAFEQYVPDVSQHFTSYAFLMDMLINSEKDVQVLKDAEVMHCHLGADEDISNLFNKLCKEVVVEDFYFADTCSRAFKYSKYGWPKILAYLKRTYFASPWAFIGFCLAFIAFGMSVTQFVLSFFR